MAQKANSLTHTSYMEAGVLFGMAEYTKDQSGGGA